MCKELLEFPWNKYKKEWCHYNYYSMLGFGNWCFLKSNLIDLQELEREQIELSTLENILCDTNLNRVTNKVAFNHLLRHITPTEKKNGTIYRNQSYFLYKCLK